ncbi:MAG: glycoside hydrolase family 31 protein [Candidatus Pseudobacter hemicellulosilyticus]|uniref:Glycoside hydrolase family 31 protein n=1 Tax=Candidatus Pseudobacter hemicellulosilyticus TaxID=3121375 RepID=A0AAJ5WX00_9BACT|nr:MAG: glycoside hydrolase family 31 protein [Pseudobacter sp.]
MNIPYRSTAVLLFLLLSGFVFTQSANGQYNGKADPKAVIQSGQARFTVLTSRVIRLEWDSTGSVNDQASFVAINRKLPVPAFKQSQQNGWLVISTADLELRYQLQSGKFNDQNLQITYNHPDRNFTWKPGLKQTGNLKGTYRTLDRCEGDVRDNKDKIQLEDGLLSRDGWHLIDDSKSLLFDNSDWPWATTRPESAHQDWYFMGYGNNYKQALYDYSLFAGKVPLPPRYAFGYWWSRYWSYSDNEVRDLVNNFEKFAVPLDVLVIDMDWHFIVNEHLPWTGYSWNKRLFPDPGKSLSWIQSRQLKTTLNLHPADGVIPQEEKYGAMAKALNFDTSKLATIPFEASNKKFMRTLFDTILQPMEKMGVDFWWLDWQQWAMDKKMPSLSNTWWLNHTFFTNAEKYGNKRPLIYHRWGGLGNHRYQIGFSGDAIISWKSLDYQPYFTNCASNVLYSYWSHDIGGHYHEYTGLTGIDPEMYARWMQYGALSPIFRSHSTKDASLNKEVWNFKGDAYDALINSINFRYQISPYIYTMARKNYDSSIAICRPLYYDYASQEEAYTFNKQYMFGDDMLVAPIGAPMKEGVSRLNVWLPGGNNWYEWNTGTMLSGGQTLERSFTLAEYPLYVKAGAIIPMYNDVKNLEKDPGKLTIGVFPGGNGKGVFYEDAGNDKNYAREYASTQLESNWKDRTQRIVINPRKGAYKGMPASRTYTVQLIGAEMPQSITVNGKPVKYTQIPNGKDWHYEGKTFTVIIPLSSSLCSARQELVIQYSKTDSINVNTGLVKQFRELTKATTGLKFRDGQLLLPELIGNCEETNLKLQYEPAKFYEYLRYFATNYPAIPDAIRKARISNENKEWYINQLKAGK